ncbi:hypothetical protein VARIO8X_90084 [Burkholderiales bacterium 8X]|nr:hypothetical protein VARIO8X_90084 [Burkholderiales bacterium 8X]
MTELERALISAVLDLFDASGSPAFCLEIPGTVPPIYIACGEAGSVNIMVPTPTSDHPLILDASNQRFSDDAGLRTWHE